jgi:uracil-DNA glycosylase
MMVGRNPGINEDRTGQPFVGRGGKVFQAWLNGLGITREHIWLTNLLKCYTTKDRKPKKVEITTCWDLHLRREIQFCRPSLIVALGSEAFNATTGKDRLSVRHGIIYNRMNELNAFVIGVIHPGSAMRSGAYLDMMREDGVILKPLLAWALNGYIRQNSDLPAGFIWQ